MKKVLIVFVFIVFTLQELSAFDKRLSLDIARAKNVERVIQRVNHIYNFINLFALETGSLPASIAQLQGRYSGIQINGFSGTDIGFTIANNIVTFQNVMAATESNFIQQLYTAHVELHPFATFNNLDMNILLKANTIGFLNKVNSIELFDDDNNDNVYDADDIFVQATAPNCSNSATDDSDMWYQPDGMGGFIVHYCLVANAQPWTRIANNVDIAIYQDSLTDLENINPPIGTRGYIRINATTVHEYIYTADTVTNPWKRVQ